MQWKFTAKKKKISENKVARRSRLAAGECGSAAGLDG